MWSILNGTIVNTATVAVGSLAGLMIASRLPERYRVIVLQTIGLVTLLMGVDAGVLTFARTTEKFAPLGEAGKTYGARLAMVMIASLLLGAVLGAALRVQERIESIGAWIHGRFSSGGAAPFARGFLAASVLFCVGPLTLLGCLKNGAYGDPSYLYIKSTLDGFSSMALASSLGAGVAASVITVIVVQGGLSLGASLIVSRLHELALDMMTVVGGVILLGTALMILDIRKIAVADIIPSLFLPPFVIAVVEWVQPGLLLPAASLGS
jgi:hypothetical protein